MNENCYRDTFVMHLSVQPPIFGTLSPHHLTHTIRRIAMKHRIVLAVGLLFICATITLGQETMGMKADTMAHEGMMMQKKKGIMKDGFLMKDGKMMMLKSGMSSPMDKEMTLANGTKVMPSGDVIMKHGKKMMMKEGMMMGMDGKMMGSGKKMMDKKPMMEKKDDMMKKQ